MLYLLPTSYASLSLSSFKWPPFYWSSSARRSLNWFSISSCAPSSMICTGWPASSTGLRGTCCMNWRSAASAATFGVKRLFECYTVR